MIEIVPASQLKEGDVFSTDGYVVTTVVALPKTERVFVQTALDGHIKIVALEQDFPCPIWTPDSLSKIKGVVAS